MARICIAAAMTMITATATRQGTTTIMTMAAACPYVKLRSNRTDLRAEYLDPFAGIEKTPARRPDRLPAPGDRGRRGRHHLQEPWLRPAPGGAAQAHRRLARRGGHADVPQRFPRGRRGSLPAAQQDARQRHLPAGGIQAGRLALRAGRAPGLADGLAQGGAPRSSLSGTSPSAAAIWNFAPEYSAALSLSRSQRLPTAQELYARACTWPPTPMRSATPAWAARPRTTST